MGFLVLSGIVMTMALLVTLCRVLHWRLVLGYATVIDVVATIVLLTLYAGTFSGMFAATVAGLVLAVTLSVGRKLLGYTVLKWNKSLFRPAWNVRHVNGIVSEMRNAAQHKAKENGNAYQNVTSWIAKCLGNIVLGYRARQVRAAERNRAEYAQGGISDW